MYRSAEPQANAARAALWRGCPPPPGIPERKPVLMLVHQRRSDPGHVGNWFAAHGFPLDVRCVPGGDPLPQTLERHTGAVIFGGPTSATDTDEATRREVEWIRVPLEEDKPLLGICLGAQMMALHLGGTVGFHVDGYAEIGYHPIRPTSEGAALFDWPEQVYQWHREGFTPPSDAVLLAEGERFEHQAYRYGRAAFGLQFHPEITQHLVTRWTTYASQRLVLPGARPREEHVLGHLRHGPGQRRWLAGLLAHWLSLA